jgi:uncharacterized protein YceK
MNPPCAILILGLLTSGCAKIITAPISVAGKVATTSIGVAGDVTVAGVKAGTKVAKSAGGDSTAVQAAALLAK